METIKEYELVIIGAGPAGLSCALEASKYKIDTLVIDENFRPGGQLFCQTHKFFGSKEHKAGIRGFTIAEILIKELESTPSVEILLGTSVYGIDDKKTVYYSGQEDGKKLEMLKAKNLVIATGAMERSIFFEGWTLPGVMTAGGLQNMMNVDRVLPGSKVLMLGSGNVGLIVSYQLIQAGAEVVAIIEALPTVKGYSVHAAKVRRLGVPIITSHTIKKAIGTVQVTGALIGKVGCPGSRKIKIDCDLICMATGLKPSDELCRQLDLEFEYDQGLGGFIPSHGDDLETSLKGVYVAGDVSGVEEASTAMEEGRLAALSIARKTGRLGKKEAEKELDIVSRKLKDLRV